MDDRSKHAAETLLRSAENDSKPFPEIVAALIQEGFESYAIDFRRSTATYYRPNGDSIVLRTHAPTGLVAPTFDTATVRAAIREAQQLVPGYTYAGFCETVIAAGCAGYLVSFSGRRAVYFGRTAETHVEHFPQ